MKRPLPKDDWNSTWLEYQSYNLRKLKSHYSVLGCDRVPRDARILDVGCGMGDFLRLLGANGFTNLSGLEPSAELVSRMGLGTAKIHQGCAADLCAFGNESFDAVFVIGVLHHLTSLKEVKQCARDVRDLLVTGGLFLSIEPRKSFLRRLATWVILDSPFWRLHPRLRIERTLVLEERRELNQWLDYEKEVTEFCNTLFLPRHYKHDWRYRYIVYEKR